MLGAPSTRTALPSWRNSPTWQAAQVTPTKSMPKVNGLDATVRPTGSPSLRAGSGNRPKRSRFSTKGLVEPGSATSTAVSRIQGRISEPCERW